MKKLITIDLLMILLAWCLYLNRYYVSAFLVNVLASVLILYVTYEKMNYWRFLTVFFFGLIIGYYTLQCSTINLFFHGFEFFVGLVLLNAACFSEIVVVTKNKRIFPFLIICLLSFAIFITFCFLIQKNDYSIFSLDNLYTLISFIFVPHTFIMLINVLIKEIKCVNHKKDKLIITKVSS